MATRVIIIGAGIAGLALAQGLKKHNIPFHIFEQETSAKKDGSRYRIRLHIDSINALQYVLPEDRWMLVQLAGADLHREPLMEIDAHTARAVVNGSAPASPIDAESERGHAVDSDVLRKLLLQGLEEDMSYGCRAMSYTLGVSGGVTVDIRDRRGALSTVRGSLLVAADGMNSTIRRQLLPEAQLLEPEDEWCISGETDLTPEVMATMVPSVLGRLTNIRDLSRGDIVSMLVEPVSYPSQQDMLQLGIACPKDHLYWMLALPQSVIGFDPGTPKNLEECSMTGEQCAQMAVQVTANWHDALRPILDRRAPGRTRLLPLVSSAPALPVWSPRQELTLMGDAIHAMSAATGSGAAMALRDAHRLCRAVVEWGGTMAAIGDYEAEMRQYAGDAINASFLAGQLLFDQPTWEDCILVSDVS